MQEIRLQGSLRSFLESPRKTFFFHRRSLFLRLARSRADRFAVVNTVEPRFKDTRLIRTLVNADNGHLFLVQSADSCRWSRQPCKLCVVMCLSTFKVYWTFRWQYVDAPSATSITEDMGWILEVNFRFFWHETRHTENGFWIANALHQYTPLQNVLKMHNVQTEDNSCTATQHKLLHEKQ